MRGPVPGRTEAQFGFGIVGGLRVVIRQGHRLPAAADDRPLGERRVRVSDLRTAGLIGEAVDPGVPDRRLGVDVVRVAVEVVDRVVLLDGEGPDRPYPLGDRLRLVDFRDLPEVRRAEEQPGGRELILADRAHRRGPGGDRLFIAAKADLVRSRLAACPPAQNSLHIDILGAVGRLGLPGLHWNLEEPNLAQARLRGHAAPVGVDRQLDELRDGAVEGHGGVRGVRGQAGAPGKFRGPFQFRPGRAVDRVFDRDVLGAESDDALDHLIGVPDQHLVQLVNAVERELNPVRLDARAHPHLRPVGRVLVQGIQAGTVDGVLRAHARLGAGGRGSRHRQRIRERFRGEAPDAALVPTGGAVGFVDSPVVGRSEGEFPGGVVALVALRGDDRGSRGDRGQIIAEQDAMLTSVVPRRPAQGRLDGDFLRSIGGAGLGGAGPAPRAGHDDVVDRPPPVVAGVEQAERQDHAACARGVGDVHEDRLIGGVVVFVERTGGIGLPPKHFDLRSAVEGYRDVGGLMVIVVVFGAPARVELQLHGARPGRGQIDRRRDQPHVIGICWVVLRMGGVVPLVRVGDRHGPLAQFELRTTLILSGLDPPILLRESPSRPLGHAVVGGVAVSGDSGGVVDPSRRRDIRPDRIPGNSFVHVRTQRQAFEILLQQYVGGLGLRRTGQDRSHNQQKTRNASHLFTPSLRYWISLLRAYVTPKSPVYLRLED